MWAFFSIFILIVILDIKDLMNLKMKKELIIYIFLIISTTALAIYYYSDTFRKSFIGISLELLNII